MSAIETDPGWYERMAARATLRSVDSQTFAPIYRDHDPVPPSIRSASARDTLLRYICDGWEKIFGGTEPIETLIYSDFGYHVLRKGMWQLTLVNVEQNPSAAFETDEG